MDALIVLAATALGVALCRCWPRPDEDRASIDNWTRVRRELDRDFGGLAYANPAVGPIIDEDALWRELDREVGW